MTARSTHRGHVIVSDDGQTWRYEDTGQPVPEAPGRPCGHCGRPDTTEGHDGCLGTLAGVRNACCGHGDPEAAYVQLVGGRRLGGTDALRWIAGAGPGA